MPDWALNIPSYDGIKQQGSTDLSRPFTQQQLVEYGKEALEQFLRRVVIAVVGAFIPGGGTAAEQLMDWADGLPNQILEWIRDHIGIDLSSWSAFLASLDDGAGIDLPVVPQIVAALSGIDFSQPGAVLAAILGFVRNLKPEWLPLIDLGSIGRFSPNLVVSADFERADTILSGLKWTWDGTDGAPDPDTGDPSVGCAKLLADGTDNALTSQSPIKVTAGQKLEVGMMFKSESVTAASGSLRLELVTRYNGAVVSTEVIAAVDPSGTSDWAAISGVGYTVPSGVDEVIPQPHVMDGVTAGVVKVDRVWAKKTQLLGMDFTENLVKRWESAAALMNITDTDLDGDIDFTDVWNTLWAGKLKPLGWVPTVAQDVIDGIYNGFANLGELLDLDRPRTDALDVIYNLLGIGVANKTSVAAIEAEIRLLKSAGNTLAEGFEGSSGGLPSAQWGSSPFRSWGGGSGSIALDGKGNAVWSRSGGSTRGHFYRYYKSGSVAQITTDAFEAGIVLASDPPDTSGDPAAYTYLGFSVPTGSTVTHGQLRIGRTKIAIEAVVSGTVTTLVESMGTVNPRAGDTFIIRRGASGNTNMHTYSVTKNGVPVTWSVGGTSFTDTGSTIPYGSGMRGLGMGMQAGSRTVIPIILFDQWIPAGVGVVTLAEVL